MNLGNKTCLNRRNLLKITGGSVLGTTALGQIETVSAQDATASVTLNDQESDGGSIVLASLQTDTDARLFITPVREEDDNLLHKAHDLSAGASFTDRIVQLDRPIQESKTVSAVIQAGEEYDQVIASDTALIAVGESLASAGGSQTAYNTTPGIQRIEKDPDAGFHSPYFLYTPEKPDPASGSVNNSQQRPLLVQVSTWPEFQDRVKNARETAGAGVMRKVADTTNSPLLVAPLSFIVESAFGLEAEGTQSTDPQRKRVDLQLIAMIEDAKSRLNGAAYTVADQIYFHGYSANGVFADTFAALHPEQVRVISSGGNGIAFLPLTNLTDDIPTHGDPDSSTVPWPIGAGDIEEISEKKFNREAWMNIDQFRHVGAEDQDPENPDEYLHKLYKGSDEIDKLVEEIFGSLQIDHRFETSRKIYNHLGVPATFTVFEEVGHGIGPEQGDKIVNYHQRKIDEHFEVIHLVPQKSASELEVGDSVTMTVTAENPTFLASTTTVTFGVDGTTVKTVEREIAPNTVSEITFKQTFDEPGTYTLSVNDKQVGEGPVTVIEPNTTPTSPTNQPSGSTKTRVTDTTGPGFGVSAALTGVTGFSYLILRQEDDPDGAS